MNKTVVSIIIALIIIAGGVWYFTQQSGTNTNTTNTNANRNINATATTKTYTSTVYGYSFTYPAGYVITDVNSQRQIVRKTADDQYAVTVSAEAGTSDDQAKSFADFAVERAISYCAAAGPDGSITCSGATKQTVLTTPKGLSGLNLTLREVTETGLTNATTTKNRGPIYALDSQSASKNKVKTILVDFSASGTSTIDETNAALAKTIAESLTFAE